MATEAELYGNIEPNNVPLIQTDRTSGALATTDIVRHLNVGLRFRLEVVVF